MKRIHVATFALVLAVLAVILLPGPSAASGAGYCESLYVGTSSPSTCLDYCRNQGCHYGIWEFETGACTCDTSYP